MEERFTRRGLPLHAQDWNMIPRSEKVKKRHFCEIQAEYLLGWENKFPGPPIGFHSKNSHSE